MLPIVLGAVQALSLAFVSSTATAICHTVTLFSGIKLFGVSEPPKAHSAERRANRWSTYAAAWTAITLLYLTALDSRQTDGHTPG